MRKYLRRSQNSTFWFQPQNCGDRTRGASCPSTNTHCAAQTFFVWDMQRRRKRFGGRFDARNVVRGTLRKRRGTNRYDVSDKYEKQVPKLQLVFVRTFRLDNHCSLDLTVLHCCNRGRPGHSQSRRSRRNNHECCRLRERKSACRMILLAARVLDAESVAKAGSS